MNTRIEKPKVVVSQIDENQVLINGKLMHQDMNGNWIAGEELTYYERKAFTNHLQQQRTLIRESEA